MKRIEMDTAIRRVRDVRLALAGLLVLSMTANLALTMSFAGRETVTVLVPAMAGPAWEIAGGGAGTGLARARYLEDMARTVAVTLLTLTPENAAHVRLAAARMSHASARGAIGAWVEAEAARMAGRDMATFELEGAPQSSAADPRIGVRSGPELVADAVAKAVSVWLPAGAHAEAVVLAGVDASAGVSSQGDPRPVLMRITSPAWTAAEDGTAMKVDVDGCTVTGAAHGDLSSEKVYVRFRTMTCAGPEPGTVVETDVAGFVAGSGKAGVRGPVVSREGALVEKAFLAGVVSGLGQGVSQAFQPQAVATGTGAAVANTGLGDIGRAGLGAGASSAGQKVADYMIRRAEQYQPVVQLQAGTKVTLVFLEGARIDGRAPAPTRTTQQGN